MESRSNTVPQKETARETRTQESVAVNKVDWREEFAQGMACGEAPDGGSHCVPYHPDPELDSIVKMCKNDSPESCKIERRKKIKELVARRKAAKTDATQSSQP